MQKKAIVLSTLFIIISILACGGSAEVPQEEVKPEIVQVENNLEAEVIEEIDEPTMPPELTPDSSLPDEITVEEQVVFAQEGISITVKSIDLKGSFFGPELKVLIENDRENNITVQVRNVSINDVMVETIFSSDVASGKKINDEITFMSSSLSAAEIQTIKEIEFYFHIFDAESWDTIIDSEIIQVVTSADDAYIQEYDDSGFVAVESSDVKIVVKKIDSEDSFWGADLFVYIENNSDQDLTFQVRDVSINGFMIDPIFSSDVVSGKKAFDSISFMESDLTDNNITDIIELEMRFHIFDMDSWNTFFDSEAVNINFN